MNRKKQTNLPSVLAPTSAGPKKKKKDRRICNLKKQGGKALVKWLGSICKREKNEKKDEV